MQYKIFVVLLFAFSFAKAQTNLKIPLEGNSWFTPKKQLNVQNLKNQLTRWESNKQILTTYIHIGEPGSINLSLDYNQVKSNHQLKLTAFGQSKSIQIGKDTKSINLGDFEVKSAGYHSLQLEKISETIAPEFNSYTISASKQPLSSINFVKNNDDNYFYWGRRGPSVHMSYSTPKSSSILYFYNEIVVPVGNDVIGSYYMANGFAEGYFGIQVNSKLERRVLFSVWSPFTTDNPEEIPEDEKIKLLSKGKDVHTGEFGNEGSGGQSYLKYNWKAGEKYKFLLKAYPVENNYTEYTAWFFSPTENEWRLIAKFARPKTNTYLKRLHSFLENFIPEQGDLERRVHFSNQWAMDKNGEWVELTKGRFTIDATGQKLFRLDYAGGVTENSFFLRNCGFFSDRVLSDASFERAPNNKAPLIDFDALPH